MPTSTGAAPPTTTSESQTRIPVKPAHQGREVDGPLKRRDATKRAVEWDHEQDPEHELDPGRGDPELVEQLDRVAVQLLETRFVAPVMGRRRGLGHGLCSVSEPACAVPTLAPAAWGCSLVGGMDDKYPQRGDEHDRLDELIRGQPPP